MRARSETVQHMIAYRTPTDSLAGSRGGTPQQPTGYRDTREEEDREKGGSKEEGKEYEGGGRNKVPHLHFFSPLQLSLSTRYSAVH